MPSRARSRFFGQRFVDAEDLARIGLFGRWAGTQGGHASPTQGFLQTHATLAGFSMSQPPSISGSNSIVGSKNIPQSQSTRWPSLLPNCSPLTATCCRDGTRKSRPWPHALNNRFFLSAVRSDDEEKGPSCHAATASTLPLFIRQSAEPSGHGAGGLLLLLLHAAQCSSSLIQTRDGNKENGGG